MVMVMDIFTPLMLVTTGVAKVAPINYTVLLSVVAITERAHITQTTEPASARTAIIIDTDAADTPR